MHDFPWDATACDSSSAGRWLKIDSPHGSLPGAFGSFSFALFTVESQWVALPSESVGWLIGVPFGVLVGVLVGGFVRVLTLVAAVSVLDVPFVVVGLELLPAVISMQLAIFYGGTSFYDETLQRKKFLNLSHTSQTKDNTD